MKAVRIARYGQAPVVEDIAEPTPGPDEVVVRVTGAAVNPLDLKIAAGHMHDFFPVTFPYVMGTDVAGTITELGSQVEGWSVGNPIVARLDPSAGGAFAERAAVGAVQLVSAPASVPLFLASGVATAAATAWQAVSEVARVHAGQKVLVHAGAGGVGSFAIQIAHRLGAHVITTVSRSVVDLARELGADEVIDRTTTDFERVVSDVDVVIDTIGGLVEECSLEVLRPGGLLIALPMPPDSDRAAARGLRAEFVVHTSDAGRLGKVMQLVDDGMRVVLDRQVGLDAAPRAMAYLANGHAKGKVILVP